MPAPAPFGYGFSEHTYSEDGVLLNWAVTARLWTIDSRGDTLQEIDRDELFIGRLRAANQPQIEVDPLKGRRGFYRFDMQIRSESGKVLGSYGAYFKVVRRTWRPSLGLSRKVVHPGERLFSRIENYGSEAIFFGKSFDVQRFENDRWIRVPDLTPRVWPKGRGRLDPGGIGGCNRLTLPTSTPPGLYRVVKGVGTYRFPYGKATSLTAPFEVVGTQAGIEY